MQKGKFVANDQPANLAGSPGSAIGTQRTGYVVIGSALSEEQTNSLKHAELFKSKSFFGWTPRAEQLLLFGKR